MRLSRVAAMAGAAVLLWVSQAAATPIQIQMTGLNLVLSNQFIADAQSDFGGDGIPTLSDPLVNVNFLVGGSNAGTQASNDWADIGLTIGTGFSEIGPGVQMASGTDGIFDVLLFNTPTNAWGVALDVTSFTVFYVASSNSIIGTGNAILCPTCSPNPSLPFGLTINGPFTFDFSGTLSSTSFDGSGNLTGFAFSGTGDINGQVGAVPEPATLLLLGSGLTGLALRRRRR